MLACAFNIGAFNAFAIQSMLLDAVPVATLVDEFAHLLTAKKQELLQTIELMLETIVSCISATTHKALIHIYTGYTN